LVLSRDPNYGRWHGMRKARIFGRLLGVQGMVVGDVRTELDVAGDEVLVASVRVAAGLAGRCPTCRRRCPGYDAGVGVRRWRTLDTVVTRTFLEAAAPRVECPEHGVVVALVPWARPGAKCTYLLEDTCAWLAKNMALSAVAEFLRLSWRTVASIVARVVADLTGKTDQLDGLARIGIDEISYRKGHRYLTCVVDHDTGRLVWAHEGRNKETLRLFFQQLGAVRSAGLTHVSADGAEWIHSVVAEYAPQALICLDPFHVVAWGMKALDKVRHRTLAASGEKDRNARWAVVKNPGAPRGARSYPRCSRERLEVISLGPMTYPDAERRRGQQHVRQLMTVSRYRNGAPGDPCDKAKAVLLESQFPAMQFDFRRKIPDTDAASCPGFLGWPGQPPGAGRCPMRVFKGTKRTPKSRCYVRPGRTWDRLLGASPMATECP
jgi:transposase